jgi:hypothetical protein
MESNKIEQLLELYFEGETTSTEEKELQYYFSSSNVAPHLEQYKPLFNYFSQAKKQEYLKEFPKQHKNPKLRWISIAASVVVLLGVGSYLFLNESHENKDLGTYDDPEIAFRETQKALALLSNHVNTGIESVHYIEEYQNSKNLIFKP